MTEMYLSAPPPGVYDYRIVWQCPIAPWPTVRIEASYNDPSAEAVIAWLIESGVDKPRVTRTPHMNPESEQVGRIQWIGNAVTPVCSVCGSPVFVRRHGMIVRCESGHRLMGSEQLEAER